MLGRKTTEQTMNTKISSIIGEGMAIEGNITAKDAIRIEGFLKGDVASEGTLVVSATGKVQGNMKGSNIMVAGTIEGDLYSEGRIEVAATGRIIGNIRTKSLIIDENAVFEGQCTMNMETASLSMTKDMQEVSETGGEAAGSEAEGSADEDNNR
ncbi:MAG: polymer-forming cytoskeletal protein [Lachnospiraceae bacterium]|nr:polymer-forming cytoskeletal protein [Lachnospiraceae bacterium]